MQEIVGLRDVEIVHERPSNVPKRLAASSRSWSSRVAAREGGALAGSSMKARRSLATDERRCPGSLLVPTASSRQPALTGAFVEVPAHSVAAQPTPTRSASCPPRT